MSKSESKALSQHFSLEFDARWQRWFDEASHELALPGMMRDAVGAKDLSAAAPTVIWPGFMLPDTLPIVGNQYGDWICARVDSDNRLGELVYWYHGGGDWIPVGACLAEALLHDAVEQFRNVRKQMLRSATESRLDTPANVVSRLTEQSLQDWMSSELDVVLHAGEARPTLNSGEVLHSVLGALADEHYMSALERLQAAGIAADATACDMLEQHLQSYGRTIASQQVALDAGVDWFPDFVRLLFDPSSATASVRERVLEASRKLHADDSITWPTQDWANASQIVQDVFRRRQDLGWAATILGWYLEKLGQPVEALNVYFGGLRASCFSDQSVRFNSHADSEEFGKFSGQRLSALRDYQTSEHKQDDYLQLLLRKRKKSLLAEVSEFWEQKAQEAEHGRDFENAYHFYYAAGWDLGVGRLEAYDSILSGLARCSEAMGWDARAQVANMHLNCLRERT